MRDAEKAGLELARKVINLSHSCDMSKLNEIELDRLNEVVEQARCMFVEWAIEPAEYNKEYDQAFIK